MAYLQYTSERNTGCFLFKGTVLARTVPFLVYMARLGEASDLCEAPLRASRTPECFAREPGRQVQRIKNGEADASPSCLAHPERLLGLRLNPLDRFRCATALSLASILLSARTTNHAVRNKAMQLISSITLSSNRSGQVTQAISQQQCLCGWLHKCEESAY